MSVLVQPGGHVGDRAVGATVYMMFTCTDATGVPTTLGGTPAVSAYRDASTTESTAGVALTVDFDARTGLCLVAIDTTADASFYSAAHDYRAVITAGTVGAVSVVGTSVGGFSLALATATLADKAGFSLAATGLDAIAVAAPTGPATTFPKMLVQIHRRSFKKSTMTAAQLKTYADDGTTVVTTQTLSDDGTTQTQGDAS